MQSMVKFVYVCLLNLFHHGYSLYPPINKAISGNPGSFDACYSLQEVLQTFELPQYRSLPQVHALLEEYSHNCQLRDMNSLPKKYPLIVIEGPRRRKRFLLAKRLARELGGAVMFSPPLGWSRYRDAFNNTTELRRAFHSLSLYGSANNALQHLGRKPVVMSGYWMDQATFAIAKKYFPKFPPRNSSVFEWPKDLLKPDFTFFINEPIPRAYQENQEESIRYQILQVYRLWPDPPVTEIYMTDDIEVMDTVGYLLKQINNASASTTSLSGS